MTKEQRLSVDYRKCVARIGPDSHSKRRRVSRGRIMAPVCQNTSKHNPGHEILSVQAVTPRDASCVLVLGLVAFSTIDNDDDDHDDDDDDDDNDDDDDATILFFQLEY
ncbi:hypothetical protein HZH68_004776 [Vespula germanica]|uniref:Uncharacterized protein n=1 Tax=Vespula germanica TaxID=30212 RepID=A0A834KPT7_VESGE|nr:hypothetical protein HZH68_004776 [Vespula germanica]